MTPSRKITEIFLPIPEHNELFEQASIVLIDFTTTVTQMRSKNGIEMKRGKIGVAYGWSERCSVKSSCQYSKTYKSTKPVIETAHDTVQKWYDDQTLDPMDPDASSLVEMIQRKNETISLNKGEQSDRMVFRFNEDLSAFCSEEEIQSNKRLNMLSARYNADLKFKNIKFVPNNEREMHVIGVCDDDVVDETDDGKQIIEDIDWMDPIDLQRHRGKKYLRSVYQVITNHCDILNKNCEAQDLLIGDGIPTIR